MRRLAPSLATLVGTIALCSTLALAGCGRDKVERGLAPSGEVDTPTSQKADSQTNAQRQNEIDKEMQEKQVQAFDAANSGKQEQKPAQ